MFGWTKKKDAKREIIVNVESLETRVAIMEGGVLEEFQVEHPTEQRIVGSIYKGRIQNLEHDLQAAFVDIGMKKNAFLHYWDMIPDEESLLDAEDGPKKRRRRRGKKRHSNAQIEKQFPPGSEIVVQVTKGPIGTKGPRVAASLSIPGRFLVMMPGASLKGVSRKITNDNERRRLKKVLQKMQCPDDVGLILRTAASGARKGSIDMDLKQLLVTWEDLKSAMREKNAPCCLYEEPDLTERVIRDWLTEDIDRIVIDSREHYEQVRSLAGRISRRAKARVQHFQGDLPIFKHYQVERQLEGALRRKVVLDSGAYLIFDETEALIAVDVNTGRHKGKGSQEEAILEVNLEAVDEVARQLRLRNIGGLLVIDFIDMKWKKHQNAVYRAMKSALKRDRARTNVLPISDLGIMEMTRQRVEESILSSMYVDCPYCNGRGAVKSALGMSVDIQRQIAAVLRKMRNKETGHDLQIVVNPTVLDRLRTEDEEFLIELERRLDGRMSFKSDASKHVEFFSISDAETGEVYYATADRMT